MADRDPQIQSRRDYPAYDADYAAWLDAQVGALREYRFDALDLEHLIDEVCDLGISNYNAFVSAIEIVLVHMLKWDVQPGKRSPSWIASIVEHRRRIARALKKNPSYKSRVAEAIEEAFDTATAKAAAETNLPLDAFPDANPYDWNAITGREHQLPA